MGSKVNLNLDDPLANDSMDPNDPSSILYNPEIKVAKDAVILQAHAKALVDANLLKQQDQSSSIDRSGLAARRDLSRVDKKI